MEQLKRTIFNVKSPDKTFSDRKNSSNFQTEHMKNKIKNVHKKKKKGNYKNIEPLSNIHDDEEINEDSKERVVEGMMGLPIATFSEDDWTQGDNIYEGGNAAVSNAKKYSNADIVNSIYNSVDNFLNKIAELVVKLLSLSFTDYNKDNIPIVKKYVCWVASIKIATLAAYNWAFMMLYKKNGERVELIDISRKRLSDAADTSKVYALLNYLLDIPLFFPEKIQEYMVSKGPGFISNYVNARICYIMLFAFLNMSFYTSASTIRNFLLDLVTANMKNPVLSYMYGTTLILYVLSFFEFKPVDTAFSIAKLVAGFPASLLLPVFSNLFKIFYLIMAAVPVASTLCFFYIVGFSFFGIFILKEWSIKNTILDLVSLKKPEIFDTFTDINRFFYDNKIDVKEDTDCNPLSFFEKITNAIFRFINFVYRNVRNISWLIMLIMGIIDYSKNIKGSVLKTVLILLHSALIIYYGYFMVDDLYGSNDTISVHKMVMESRDFIDKESVINEIEEIANKKGIPRDQNGVLLFAGLEDEIAEIKKRISIERKENANAVHSKQTLSESIQMDIDNVKSFLNVDINNLPDFSNVTNKVSDVVSKVSNVANNFSDVVGKVSDVGESITNKFPVITDAAANLANNAIDMKNQMDYGKATLTQDVAELRKQFSDVNSKLDAILTTSQNKTPNSNN